ncbi:MAG: polyprenyl synthetase family protein [Candidatus Bathyarchaeia archaeon]|jgi:geranylgeranyl pyrophosphate synthase
MSGESLAKKIIATLNQKSEKAIDTAKQLILEDKFTEEKINQTIEQYTSRWNDSTRPGTLALAFEAVGGKPDGAVPLQTALVLIDATMDIHDDIIDGSTAKKNVKTVFGRLGKEAALLLGDAFMVKGFSQLNKATEKMPKERKQLIVDAAQSFLHEVVDAHITEAQLKAKKWNVSPETYLQVLTRKAADIDGRMKIGAIYGGGSPKEVQVLSRLGRNLGVLLVIRAEYIDMFETDELSNRVKNECLPLPLLYAIQNKTAKGKIKKSLLKEKITQDDCNSVIEILDNTKEAQELKEYLTKIASEIKKLTESIKGIQARNDLNNLAASLLESL